MNQSPRPLATIGQGASATGNGSVALGQGSADGGVANVVSVSAAGDERAITNVAAGAVTATSTDAVNGSQLFAVQTTANTALSAATTANTNAGSALAAATAANAATYRGEAAFRVSLTHRLNTESPFAISAGYSHSGGKDRAGKVGVAGEF